MKIAIMTPVFPPYRGGIGSVVYHNALRLSQRGYELVVLTPNYQKNRRVYENMDGISIVRMESVFRYGNAAYIPQSISALDRLLSRGDVLWLHYPFFGGVESLIRFFKKKPKKERPYFLMTYHMDALGEGWKRGFFSLHRKIFLSALLELSDRIIATSFDYLKHSYAGEYYRKHPEKFFEIPNGVDTNFFTPQQDIEQMKMRMGYADRRIVLFVGGLDRAHYFKGIVYLLKAFSSLPPSSLLFIVGNGDMLSQYQKQARLLQIEDRVIFFTDVSQQELPDYYNLCDVFVLPSIDSSEAFGIVLLEAMACGKPVVASNLPGVRTLVEGAKSGFLVEPKDIKNLRLAIESILQDQRAAKEMGMNGRRYVEERYDWEKIADTLEEVLTSL